MLRVVKNHDGVGAADVAPLGTGAEVSDEKRPGILGVGIMRALLVVVYLLLAWPLVLPDSATFPWDIPEGIAIAALTLVVVAGINLAWRRRRWSQGGKTSCRPALRVSLTTTPVLLVALVLAMGAAANRAAQSQHERQRLATTDAVSVSPLDRDRGAYAAWMTNLPAATMEEALALRNLGLVRAEEKRAHPSRTRLTSDFAAAQAHAQNFLAASKGQPAATPAVQAIKTLHVRGASTLVAATTDYVRGLRPFNQKLLDAGDTLFTRFMNDLKQAGVHGDALYQRLGGYSAFKHRVDFQAYSDQMVAAKKAANP